MLDKTHIEESIRSMTSGFGIIWLHSGISLFVLNRQAQEMIDAIEQLEAIQQIRIFNEELEIKYWRSQGELKSRKRIDDVDSKLMEEVKMVLRGSIVEKLLKTDYQVENNKKAALITKQYIGFSDIGQAGFVDYRFVGFDSI